MKRHTTRSVRSSALACVVVGSAAALALTSCSSGGSSGSSGSGAANSGSLAARSSLFPGKVATGSVIKVGVINAEGGTGISQPEGREAATAVVRYANENLGGIAGHKIEVVSCKEQEDPASALNCANEMVQQGVVGVAVPSTGQGDVMVPVLTKAGIPYVTPAGSSAAEYVTKGSFILTSGLPGQVTTMAQYAKSNGYKSVMLFVLDAGTAVAAYRSAGEPAFKSAGVELTVNPVGLGIPDATSIVAAALRSHPDVIGVIADANACTAVLKSLDDVKSTIPRWVGSHCMDAPVLKALGADGLDGDKNFSWTDTVTDDPDAQLYRAVMAKYSPGTSLEAGASVFGFQVMLSLLRAADKVTGDVSAANLLQAFESAKDVPLAAGHGLTFTCDGQAIPDQPAVCGHGALVETVKNGKIASVELVAGS